MPQSNTDNAIGIANNNMLVIMDKSVKQLTLQIIYTKEIIDDLAEQGYIESIADDLKKKLNEMEETISEYYRNQMK